MGIRRPDFGNESFVERVRWRQFVSIIFLMCKTECKQGSQTSNLAKVIRGFREAAGPGQLFRHSISCGLGTELSGECR